MSPETFIAVEKIGGNWAIARSNPPVIEAGSHHPRLERLHGRTYVLVAKEPFPYKYIGDDCVIFTTLTTQYQLWAACGEVPPINVVAIADSRGIPGDLFWNDVQKDPIRINGQEFSWSLIRQHARAGQSFHESAP